MNTNDLRRTYLEFFAAKDHDVMPSASLIPVDPALLLNVAGTLSDDRADPETRSA